MAIVIPERLFVYGTLMPGRVNHHYLQAIDGTWEKASVKGRLYPEGIGLAAGYPALVLDQKAVEVSGWLLTSEYLDTHWNLLDAFEGVAYRRVMAEVETLDNTRVQAYVYVLAKSDEI